jgi:tRNA pseudouridine65 synthase
LTIHDRKPAMHDMTPLSILHQDDALVVIDKPAGLLVHRSELDRHERRFAVQILRDQLGRYVYPVHRLDKGTSGPVVFAFDTAIAGRLGGLFERQAVRKQYVAIVRGHPPLHGTIDHPLRKRHDRKTWHPAEPAALQAARTSYRRLATTELPQAVDRYPSSRYALLALTPETGRQHQLRRHLKHIAHPIIGDATYGKGVHNRLFQTLYQCQRLLLACVELQFAHPLSGEMLTISTPLAADFVAVVRQIAWTPETTSDSSEIELYLSGPSAIH